MANYQLTHGMKRHAILIAIPAKHSDVEIARLLEVTRPFVYKDWKVLEGCSSDVSPVANRKKHSQCLESIKTQ